MSDTMSTLQALNESLKTMRGGMRHIEFGEEAARQFEAALAASLAAVHALHRIKIRLHFMGWPAESFWNGGTAEKPHWIPDWRYEIALIEHVLHGSPIEVPEFSTDTKPWYEIAPKEIWWMYEHDGCMGPPLLTRQRKPVREDEPWTETALIPAYINPARRAMPSSLAVAGIAREVWGNPIPQEAYRFAEALLKLR